MLHLLAALLLSQPTLSAERAAAPAAHDSDLKKLDLSAVVNSCREKFLQSLPADAAARTPEVGPNMYLGLPRDNRDPISDCASELRNASRLVADAVKDTAGRPLPDVPRQYARDDHVFPGTAPKRPRGRRSSMSTSTSTGIYDCQTMRDSHDTFKGYTNLSAGHEVGIYSVIRTLDSERENRPTPFRGMMSQTARRLFSSPRTPAPTAAQRSAHEAARKAVGRCLQLQSHFRNNDRGRRIREMIEAYDSPGRNRRTPSFEYCIATKVLRPYALRTTDLEQKTSTYRARVLSLGCQVDGEEPDAPM